MLVFPYRFYKRNLQSNQKLNFSTATGLLEDINLTQLALKGFKAVLCIFQSVLCIFQSVFGPLDPLGLMDVILQRLLI